jgi:hypothetical protein
VAGVTATTTAAVPVPLRPIAAVLFVEELLAMVSWPVAAPTAAGSNSTFSVVSWLGLKLAGNSTPDTEKPAPVSVAPSIVTGTVPVEVIVTDCVAGVFTTTLPNATLVALMLNANIEAFSCRVKLLNTLPALAVIVTACEVATEDTVAVNPALVAFGGTITVLGTVTAELLLDRLTLRPPLGADAVSVTVHASVPDPVMAPLLQNSALNAAGAAVPVPLRLMSAVPLVDELLLMLS